MGWFNHQLHSGKLTWQWKIHIFNRKYIFKGFIFHCYVSLPAGSGFSSVKTVSVSILCPFERRPNVRANCRDACAVGTCSNLRVQSNDRQGLVLFAGDLKNQTNPRPMTDPWDDCISTYMNGWCLYGKCNISELVNVDKYTSPMDAMGRETQNSVLRWVWQSDFCSAGGTVNLFNQLFDWFFGWFTEFSPVGGWAASSCVVWRQTFQKEMMMMLNFTKIVEAKRSHMNYTS